MNNKHRQLSLALQGGGAHGAFTWGVLDALLEDGRVSFDGISGTSAGAMNAVVLAHGLLHGGRQGARTALSQFWNAVARSLPFALQGEGQALSPAFKMMLHWTDYLSPEQLNPMSLDPLREIIAGQIDFAALRRSSPVKLFLAATHANSGKLRLFLEHEVSIDALMASACLPTLQRAVEIDGEPYWDGGFAANPAVFPLFYDCAARDILLVLLCPLKFEATPYSAEQIKIRSQELAFNATFLREMRMFAHLSEYSSRSWMPLSPFERRLQRTFFHVIDMDEQDSDLASGSKLATHIDYFERLRDSGRRQGLAWLATHFRDLGARSSVRLSDLFY
jgi:NTE family protein